MTGFTYFCIQMHYNRTILVFLLLLLGIHSKCQIIGPNLINNPSFEQYYSCPVSSAELFKSKYWWGFSTDYFNICVPSIPINVSIPLNFAGFQYAHTGVAYAGVELYANDFTIQYDYREAIKTKLNDTLVANKRYCTKFYISLAEYSYSVSQPILNYVLLDSIGMLLTKDSVQDTLAPLLNYGIRVQNSIFNIDTISWSQISNSFIANGGEQYLTISNFDININWPIGITGETYVYVDDVSVCECAYKINLGNDTTLCQGEALLLNASLQGATYLWQDGSTNSTYLATQPGKYKVTAYIKEYNIIVSDSINISFTDSCFVIPNVFTPNNDGFNDYFVIKNTESWNIDLQVYDRWGVIVYKDENYKNNWDGKSKGKDLADGTYYYIIKATNQLSGFEKQYHGSLTILR